MDFSREIHPKFLRFFARSFVAPTALTVFSGSAESPTALCSINLEAKPGSEQGKTWENVGKNVGEMWGQCGENLGEDLGKFEKKTGSSDVLVLSDCIQSWI